MRKAPKRHRFTTDRVRRTFSPPPEGATTASGKPITQALYWDEQTEGLGVVVSETNRSFIVQRWVDGDSKRCTIGRVYGRWLSRNVPADWRTDDVCSLKAAREAARKIYDSMGDDARLVPFPASTPAQSHSVLTLREAFDLHRPRMLKKGSEEHNIAKTLYLLELHLDDWLDLPLSDITKKMCEDRHAAITAEGKATTANNVFEMMRAVWNTARDKRDNIPENATASIDWNTGGKSVTSLPWAELPAWAKRTDAIKNPIRRDLWWFILFTGLRATDACTVRWEHLNLTDSPITKDFGHGEVVIPPGCIHRPKPKGGKDRAFTVPLSKPVVTILRRRKAENIDDGGWVWPANSKNGHVYANGLKESEYGKDGKKRTVSVHPHRLRHTFATIARDAKVSETDLGVLMNHTKPSTAKNITARYIGEFMNRLRPLVEDIADKLLEGTGRLG